MRTLPWLAVLSLCACAHVPPGHEDIPGAHVVLTWPRMTAQQLGCSLNAQFTDRGDLPACTDVKYPQGDPCVDPDNWYAGPQLPDGFASQVHPNVKRVRLSWEHGHVQAVMLLMDDVYNDDAARVLFAIDKLPSNVMAMNVQRCLNKASCVVITGFDHMGGGEVQCGDDG